MGKKYYPLKSYHIKRLITHVEKGGVLEGHRDVPEAVRDKLYREEQERSGRDKRKESHLTGAGSPYPPININVSSLQSAPLRHDILAPKAADNLQTLSSLDIPGLRDVAVKEYSEWQVSNVENDTLKSAFREVCDVMLENGLDLEQVYRDQDPHFFIEKGIKIGSARRFVEDIGKWVESLKKPYQPLKIISLNNLALGAGIKALGVSSLAFEYFHSTLNFHFCQKEPTVNYLSHKLCESVKMLIGKKAFR